MESILKKLFQLVPTSSMSNEVIAFLVGFGGLLIVMYILVKIIKRKTKNKFAKKVLRELPAGLLTFGLIDLGLVYMRHEGVRFLSMRLWWVVFWIAYIAWVALKIKKYFIIKKRIERAKRGRIN